MSKYLAAVAIAAALSAVALMVPNRVNAGASASAPSKYAQANHANQQRADRHNYPITEYSSSGRRTNPQH
jgi:hypothetical protein